MNFDSAVSRAMEYFKGNDEHNGVPLLSLRAAAQVVLEDVVFNPDQTRLFERRSLVALETDLPSAELLALSPLDRVAYAAKLRLGSEYDEIVHKRREKWEVQHAAYAGAETFS